MTSFASRALTACMALGLAFTPVAATAKAAARLNDLVGARAAGAETDLQNRGFVQTGGNKSSSTAYSFWWDADAEACVMVSIRDGRVSSIDDRSPRECDRGGGSGSGGYNSGDPNNNQYGYDNAGPPPKVMLNKNGTASASLPGCLANFDRNGRKTSSFSSCKPEDLRRMTDAVAATRREQGLDNGSGSYSGGYNGGYNSGYSGNTPTPKLKQQSNGTLEVTVGKCRAYYTPDGRRGNATSACEPRLMQAADDAAASFRREQGGYGNGYRGEGNGQPNYGGGPAQFSDLVGAKAAGVDTDLQSRGFRNVDGFETGNGKGTIWWNSRTRQCLQMITVNGRADSIEDIQTHQNCR
jgi:hypothetical protein